MVDIDGEAVDLYATHFAFSNWNHIHRMDDLRKLALLPNLRSANFCGTNLDDVGLEHLTHAMSLENLNLQGTNISNAGLAHLARLSGLQYLRLKENKQLTNDCVPHLLRLTNLVDLQIHETSIDQQGLNKLDGLTALRNLCVDAVWNSNYTFDGLLALSARMPDCEILAKGHGHFLGGRFSGTWHIPEQQWLACTEVEWMLDHLPTMITYRKVWLLAACCCARIPLLEPTDLNAIGVATRFIDGDVDEPDLRAATAPCGDHAVTSLCEEVLDAEAFEAVDRALGVMVRATDLRWYEASLDPTADPDAVRLAEQATQAGILRHIVGNPFRPYPAADHWPANITQLADALYHGADCGFALHDALAEAGHPELADHFRQEQVHPKGCWVLDLLLHKK